MPEPTEELEVVATVQEGRRKTDLKAVFAVAGRAGKSAFFYAFGMFLDVNHKPSMSRIMLALWTYIGWLMIHHELNLVAGQPALQNAVWTAWWAAEGFLCAAVFAPSAVANYFTTPAAASAFTAIASSTRDAIMERRAAATRAGSDGTEYTD